MWRETTSTRGGRWAIAIAAAAVACLLLLGIGIAGLVVLRHHDQFGPAGQRQNGFSRGQIGPGNGRGPGGDTRGNGTQPGMPGAPGARDGRAQGPAGAGKLLGGTALHGNVSANVNGSVQALAFQRGEVTAVSATSITLKSSDGFTGTYGLNATTRTNGPAAVKGGQAFVLSRASDKVALRMIARPAKAAASS